jgi:transcriptional regulator with XRE-family HTH domain
MRKERNMNDEMLINMIKNTVFYKDVKMKDIAKACNMHISALSNYKNGNLSTISEDKKKDLYNFLIQK